MKKNVHTAGKSRKQKKITAESMLRWTALGSPYNKKTRNLKIVNALGDTRVRAGSMVVINLALGDMNLKNFMLVEKVKHTFKLDQHFMDLTLRGGEFVA